MKILLINLPNTYQVIDQYTPDYVADEFLVYPPLGLLYIATNVDKKHNLKLLDVVAKKYTIKQIISEIKAFNPNLLGISTVTNRIYSMALIAKEIKKLIPKIKIVIGGPHTSIYPKETINLEYIDYVLTGYCEYTFPQLVETIDGGEKKDHLLKINNLLFKNNGKIIESKVVEKPIILDNMPFPDRSLINLNDYYTLADKKKMTTINSSRGCPYRCIFCDTPDKKYHYRSAGNLLEEIEEIVKLGINEIHIFDDTFNAVRKRVVQFCESLIESKLKISWSARVRAHPLDKELLSLMKKSGCYRLHIGVESGNPKILEYINKKITREQIENAFRLCNKLKIKTLAYFIIGFPNQTLDECRQELDFIKSIKPTYILATTLYPLPGSQFYDYLLQNKIYNKDYWLEFAKNPQKNFSLPLWRDRKTEKELQKILDEIYRKFYLSPNFIIKDLILNFNINTIFKKIIVGAKLFLKK